MNKHLTIFLFVIIFTSGIYSQTGWQRIYPYPSTEGINSSFFINSNTGWISDGYELYKTTNGGINWIRNLKDNSSFGSVFFINQSTGWAATNREVFKTTNTGASWISCLRIDTISINRLFFLNSSTGWASTQTGMLKTTNGGAIWSSFGSIVFPIHIIYFKNSNTGFAGWGNFSSKILMTTNSGANWDTVLSNYDCHDLKFINQTTGFISAYTGKILKTTNSGLNWFQVFNSGLTWNFGSISFVDSLTGWVSGDRYGVIAKTTNCGQNWVQLNTGIAHWFNCSFFTDINTGWIFSDWGDIYRTTNGGNNFIQQSKSLNANLYSVYFTNANTGFMSGYYDSAYYPNERGIILKSTDGGMIWDTALSGFSGNLYSLNFINQNTGLCGSSNGKIWKTTNAGISWDSSYVGFTDYINDFFFINSTSGWAATNQGLLKTTNTGLNWIRQFNGIDFECVYFLNENTGWAGGYWTKFVKTTNGGLNWVDQTLPIGFQSYVTSTYFFDANTGFAVSTGYLCKTTNGGNNWTYSEFANELYKLIFKGNIGWAMENYGRIWKTTNRGESWIVCITDSANMNTNSIFFLDQNTGWIAGWNSVLLKTTDGGVWVKRNNTKLPDNYSLEQNYPNPFNSETKIRFSIKQSGIVKLNIYDITGREITSLLNENMAQGIYEIAWSAENYASGIYFYRIKAGVFTEVKKMVLIK